MEYDLPRPIPTSEKPSATPEFIQECVDLKEAIDGHVDDWYEHSISSHAGTKSRFSLIIIEDCKPITEEIEEIITKKRFENHLNQEETIALRAKLERQKLLAVPANDPLLDDAEIDNPRASQAFFYIGNVRRYPNSNKAFAQAYDHLYRLYAKREELARIIGPKDIFDTSNMFSNILTRIFEDRHLGFNSI